MNNLLVGQVVIEKIKSRKLKSFVENNKIKLVVISISSFLLITYAVLLYQFINLIKILKFL